jgi:hypothetical protein
MTDTTLAERLARCVRKLEWLDYGEGRGQGSVAEALGKTYRVEISPTRSGWWAYWADRWYPTLKAAQAAAQADYTARILAALDMDALALEVEAMVGAGEAEQRGYKDAAYLERNKLVALLASLYPSGIKRTAIEGWSADWHGCVYIDFPWGQASWHYHDSHAGLFEHLPPYAGEWDGHTTEEKYAAIVMVAAAIRAREGGKP